MKNRREPILTVPNLLTLSRVPLAGAAWAAPGSRVWLMSLLAVAAITDVFDGRFARALRARRLRRGEDPGRIGDAQAIGAWLDPICDKIFAVSLLGAVVLGFRPPLPVVLLVLTRELLVAPLYAIYRLSPWLHRRLRFDFRAGRAGKLTTVGQFVTVLAILLAPAMALASAIVTSVLGAIAAADYARRGLTAARRSERDQLGEAGQDAELEPGAESRTGAAG